MDVLVFFFLLTFIVLINEDLSSVLLAKYSAHSVEVS